MPDITYKPVFGLKNYLAGEDGYIYSQKVSGLFRLKPHLNVYGYYMVSIRRHTYLVHRLIAKAFCPTSDEKQEVNHKNGIKTDNRPINLEWCSRLENIRHSFRVLGRRSSMLGRRGVKSPYSKPILQLKDNKVIAKFYGTREAERITGIKHQNIQSCLKGRYKHSGGFVWKYE